MRVDVSEMTEADLPRVMRLRARAWAAAYAGLVPAAYLDAMDPDADARNRAGWFRASRGRVTDLLACDAEGELLGWASYGLPRPGEGPAGELFTLYAAPERVGTGVGRRLVDEVHGRLAGPVALWVLEGNHRARRFYERSGYRAEGTRRPDDYRAWGGPVLNELRYVRD
ncbi:MULTISPECIES: GNAT family N-acetyltransferase [unclassified Streptomyces]|uniref:GNAT family N-acetyltransferase n=1 Tax=unclassified Streptomyces TaxID=2593676 RepID=UPI001F440430|nr:GNAT family N-acetyltransferase [Streptomyces sp. CLI2509]